MTTVPVTLPEQHLSVPVMAPAGAPAGAAALSIGDVLRVLKQRVFLILFVWLFFVGAVVGLTAFLDRKYPYYTAQSAILVESPFPKAPMQLTQPLLQVELMNRYVADQALLVKDEGVLSEAMTDAELMSTAWYQSNPDKNELLDELLDDLSVKQAPNTSYLIVKFSTHSVEDAPRIVNTVIRKYLARVKSMSLRQFQTERDTYRDEVARLKREIDVLRDRKANFIASEFAVPGVTQGLNVVGETYRSLAEEVTRLEAEKLQLKAAADNLRALGPREVAISPQTRMLIEQDPQIASLMSNQLALRQAREMRLRRVGEKHRTIQDLDAQLAAVQEELDRLTLEKEDEARQYQLSQAETAYLNATQAELMLRERMLTEQARQQDIDRKLATFRNLEEEQLLLERQYQELYSFQTQLDIITSGEQGIAQVRQVGQALPPREKSFPRWGLNIGGGAVLGLILAVGLAMLLELSDTSVKTPRDLVRFVHIPILGTVPDVDDEEIDIPRVELACLSHPRSMMAEAFRGIRTNLLLSSPAEQQRSVMVASSRPEEGRTTIAANLAVSIAVSGRRVLLVDANFHRPALRGLFPKALENGLSNVLIGQGRLEDLVAPTELPNLEIMASGPIPPNPTELLAGSYMRDFLIWATGRYDQVIFDGPPVLLVSDALVLASVVDGVVFVCRAKAASRGVVQRGKDQIERVGGRIFGAVLNGAQSSRGGYFREQIRNYYEYQPEQALEGRATPVLPDGGRDSSSEADGKA